jgi:hypothetical protein
MADRSRCVVKQLRTQPVRKGRSRRTASVTVGLIAPGVHLGSGKGSPLRTWTRHGLRSAARPSGRDARGFTDSTGQSAQVTFVETLVRSETAAAPTTTQF